MAKPKPTMCPHARPSAGMCPWCLGINNPEKVWILYSQMDEDSTILETFSHEEGPPTDEYIKEMYGCGFLYQYDLVINNDGKREAINGFPCPPKGFDV